LKKVKKASTRTQSRGVFPERKIAEIMHIRPAGKNSINALREKATSGSLTLSKEKGKREKNRD